MRGLIEAAPWLLPVVLLLVAIAVGVLFSFVPVRLWIEAWFSGVRIGLGHLVGMRLRKVSPPAIIRPLIAATKAGLALHTNDLEAHYLAGGSVEHVVRAPRSRRSRRNSVPSVAGSSLGRPTARSQWIATCSTSGYEWRKCTRTFQS
ncbi:MAG: hypothetical protein GTO22_01750 [Gemmatimonadales bacterium]|nr:hypothetical protein [Gemmatimonadales bacterium]